ncbi:MAG: PIN domain-containing protein [Coriobacteriales bacterium]|jgi:predicted nucleic acid-binding protein|nr:PIN domain-containing protein [Coriobacteriales bacterium]
MIVDTDVLIDYFRGLELAKSKLASLVPFRISAITLMELLQGARNKNMMRIIERQLKVWNVSVIQTTEATSIRAVQFVREFALSSSVQAADALIAATAIEEGETLLTGNEKHFRCIPGLSIEVFKH